MTDIPDGGFTNSDQLKVWLNSLPEHNIQPFAVVLASRAALRVLPLIALDLSKRKDPNHQRFRSTLTSFRANLVSSVACSYATPEMKIAASSTVAAAAAFTSSAAFVAVSVVVVATSAFAASAASLAAHLAATESSFVANSDVSSAASCWSALTSDADFLQQGRTVKQLVAEPIWMDEEPDWWGGHRLEFHKKMLFVDTNSSNSNWTVWWDWYNARINGRPAFDLPIKIAEALEMRIALGDNRETFWNREPHEINTEIASWVEVERRKLRANSEPVSEQIPEIPTQAIAPLETEIVDNQVVVRASQLAQSPAGTEIIHKILRAEAADLAERLRGQMPDAANLMNACRENLAAEIREIDIYGVDYFWGALVQVGKRADEQLLEDAAGRLSGFIHNLERFLKQFPEWVAYHRQADLNEFKVDPKFENVDTGKDIAIEIAKHTDVVTVGVSVYLGKMTLALSDGHAQNSQTAYGFMRSLANVLQSIGSIALGSGWTKGYKKQLHEESTKWAARTTLALGTEAARVLLLNIASELMGFSLSYPYMFGWVVPLLRYLRTIA